MIMVIMIIINGGSCCQLSMLELNNAKKVSAQWYEKNILQPQIYVGITYCRHHYSSEVILIKDDEVGGG